MMLAYIGRQVERVIWAFLAGFGVLVLGYIAGLPGSMAAVIASAAAIACWGRNP